jgi:hypothetical protein
MKGAFDRSCQILIILGLLQIFRFWLNTDF